MTEDRSPTFEDLYAAHYAAVRTYAARHFGPEQADDIAQDTMLRALGGLPALDLTRSLRRWLLTVARNVGVDSCRRSQPLSVEPGVLVALSPAQPDASDVVHARVDVGGTLAAALRRLSVRDRQVITMHAVHGFSVADISRVIGVPANVVRQRLLRARRNLARHYRDLGGRPYGA